MLTIFTAPKPFEGHIGVIQRNAVRSWLALGAGVEVLLVGDEPGISETARAFGVRHLPLVERNSNGTPLVSSVFERARTFGSHELLCYVNADILLLDDLLDAVRIVRQRFERFLIAGQRWDLEVRRELDANGDGRWLTQVREQARTIGKRHPPAGSDYFVFAKGSFADIPPFALGRAGWDNWMIYAGRRARLPVVDVSHAVDVIHQTHDYAHLPGGRAHYRLPESQQNVSLAGGRETVFTLRDANWELTVERSLVRRPFLLEDPIRRIETALVARLGPGRPARLVRRLARRLREQNTI